MADKEKKSKYTCKAGEEHIKWGNSPGIAAPSETAEPQMESEGFSDKAGVEKNPERLDEKI